IGARFQYRLRTVLKIDQHFITFARRDKQATHGYRCGKVSAIRSDNVECAAIRKPQVEELRVGAVEQAQSHQSAPDASYPRSHAVDYDGIAAIAGHDVHRPRLIDWRDVTVEETVLQNERQIIDAIAARQAYFFTAAVFQNQHAGKAGIHLFRGLAVRVRVEPGGGLGLVDVQAC